MRYQDCLVSGLPSFRDEHFKVRGSDLAVRFASYGSIVKEVDEEGFLDRDDTYGDILGTTVFKPASSYTSASQTAGISGMTPRNIAGISHCWPAIHIGNHHFLPVHDKDFTPDIRFQPKSAAVRFLSINQTQTGQSVVPQQLPNGAIGVIVAGTKEDGPAEDIFISGTGGGSPDGAALLAPNLPGANYGMGTIVYDMQADMPDVTAFAQLQSAWRILMPAGGTVGVTGGAGVPDTGGQEPTEFILGEDGELIPNPNQFLGDITGDGVGGVGAGGAAGAGQGGGGGGGGPLPGGGAGAAGGGGTVVVGIPGGTSGFGIPGVTQFGIQGASGGFGIPGVTQFGIQGATPFGQPFAFIPDQFGIQGGATQGFGPLGGIQMNPNGTVQVGIVGANPSAGIAIYPVNSSGAANPFGGAFVPFEQPKPDELNNNN